MPCLCATDKCINLITCFSIFHYFVNLDCKVATVILAGESKKKILVHQIGYAWKMGLIVCSQKISVQ